MKKISINYIIMLMVFLLLCSNALGNKTDILNWSKDYGYTFQSWEFNAENIENLHCPMNFVLDDKPISPGVPGMENDIEFLAPDSRVHGIINKYYDKNHPENGPKLLYALIPDGLLGTWTHYAPFGVYNRCGYYGGMSDTALVFMIPSDSTENKHKEVLVEYLIFASPDTISYNKYDNWFKVEAGRGFKKTDAAPIKKGIGAASIESIEITDTTNLYLIQKKLELLDEEGSENEFGAWHRVTAKFFFNDNPEKIYLKLYSFGFATMVDEVSITTKSIDEIPLEITSSGPGQNKTDVKVDSPVFVEFNFPLDKNNVNSNKPFKVVSENDNKEIQGEFIFKNADTKIIFTPHRHLRCDTTYKVIVQTGLQDKRTRSYNNSYSFSFTTEKYMPPELKITGMPDKISDDNFLKIEIKGTGIYGCQYRFDNGHLIGPLELEKDSNHIEVSNLYNGCHSIEIMVLDALMNWSTIETFNWEIKCPVTATRYFPKKFAKPNANVTVIFNQPMNRNSVQNAFNITPYVLGIFVWKNDFTVKFIPDGLLDLDTTYNIEITQKAKDHVDNFFEKTLFFSFEIFEGKRIVKCPVKADTYILFSGMGGGPGFPNGTLRDPAGDIGILKASGMPMSDSRILIKFDLSDFDGSEIKSRDIVKTDFHYYMLKETERSFRMALPPSDAGIPMYGIIYALSTKYYEYPLLRHPLHDLFWNEDEYGGKGYVNMKNKPGYVPGAPVILAVHTKGPNSEGAVEITDIMKGWTDGIYPNNGIELKDRDDRSYENHKFGDGYNWLIACSENTTGAPPYLLVELDAKLRVTIDQRSENNLPLVTDKKTLFTASYGNSNNYFWKLYRPLNDIEKHDGIDFEFTPYINYSNFDTGGFSNDFLVSYEPGLYRITVTDNGHESKGDSDTVFFQAPPVLSESSFEKKYYKPSDKLKKKADQLFPLFYNEAIGEDLEAIYAICENLVDKIGDTGKLKRIYTQGTKLVSRLLIGGENKISGAVTCIESRKIEIARAHLTEELDHLTDTQNLNFASDEELISDDDFLSEISDLVEDNTLYENLIGDDKYDDSSDDLTEEEKYVEDSFNADQQINESVYGKISIDLKDANGKKLCDLYIPLNGLRYYAGDVYIAVTDTKLPSYSNACTIKDFTIYTYNDGKLQVLDDKYIKKAEITLFFDPGIIHPDISGSDPFRDGEYFILSAQNPDVLYIAKRDFFTRKVAVEDIIDIDYEKGWIKFETDHLTCFDIAEPTMFVKIPYYLDHKKIGRGGEASDLCFIATSASSYDFMMSKVKKIISAFFK